MIQCRFSIFLFINSAANDFYTLSLHDALPISFSLNKRTSRFRGIIHKPLIVIFSDRKSTRLNSSHVAISYAVFCLKKKSYKGGIGSAARVDSDEEHAYTVDCLILSIFGKRKES